MKPTVSICMPHLNSQPYTEERMESILRQTLADVEVIIVDSNSDDGSLEILKRYAAEDARVRIIQAPRDGIYPNFNRAIEAGRGDFVYIATSDDTMEPDCLEKMVGALRLNPDCRVCHCNLQYIDGDSEPINAPGAGWEALPSTRYFGDWMNIHHVRQAPHDGLLHMGYGCVFTSLTQLLVRRAVYQDLGLFRTDAGSYSDFEWGMRVGLNENVVHVAEKLATWRRHDRQATTRDGLLRACAEGEYSRLVQLALKSLEARNPELATELDKGDLRRFHLANELGARRDLGGSAWSRLFRIGGYVGKHPLFSLEWLFRKVVRHQKMTGRFDVAVRAEFERLRLPNLLTRSEA